MQRAKVVFFMRTAEEYANVNDAILATTAMRTNGAIYCLNRKHYPMPGGVVHRAWKGRNAAVSPLSLPHRWCIVAA